MKRILAGLCISLVTLQAQDPKPRSVALSMGASRSTVSARTLRDIVGASSEVAKFDFVNNNAPFALMGWAGYLAPATIVAPGVLFEEMEIERIQDQTVKPPVTAAPALR